MQLSSLCLWVTIVILTSNAVWSQEFLVLEKMGTKKRFEYYTGEEIIFRLKGEKQYRTEEILGLGDTTIVLGSGPVPLKQIDKVGLANKKNVLNATGGTLIFAGIGYMLIDLFNKTIRPGEVYVDGKVARSSGVLTGSGIVLFLLSTKKVSLKKNWRLRIVDL